LVGLLVTINSEEGYRNQRRPRPVRPDRDLPDRPATQRPALPVVGKDAGLVISVRERARDAGETDR
jgi:hypothetical protein